MQISTPIDKDTLSDFKKFAKMRIRRCLSPPGQCHSPAIHAHSVQRSRFLRLLAKDGHVARIHLQANLSDGLVAHFKLFGTKKATTFTGLCAQHDNEMFANIEKSDIDYGDPQHLFLLAYRSALYELHEQMEAATMLNGAYSDRVERGLDDPDQISRLQVQVTGRLMMAYEVYCYKEILDSAFMAGDYSILSHNVVRVSTERPTVAGSALYSVDDVDFGDSCLRIHLSVLPVSEEETVATFSYLRQAGRLARRHLRPVLTKRIKEIPHNLSRFILDGCGNLVLAPSYLESWSQEKKDAVLEYFIRTAWRPDLSSDSPHYDIFMASR